MTVGARGATGRVLVCLGTRPEAIKLAPVLLCARRSRALETIVVSTGQHAEADDDVLRLFGLDTAVRLHVMRSRQGLAKLSARCLTALSRVFEAESPDLVLVQGDTTSAAMAALAGFYHHVPVWHVEAGLRTGNPRSPFPEEMNRRLISRLASFHFAATPAARRNLLREGIDDACILVTGNTAIDALIAARAVRDRFTEPALERFLRPPGPVLVVTMHRRENWGDGIRRVVAAVRRLADALPELRVVHAAHPNPDVRRDVEAEARGHPRILVTDPLGYGDFVLLLARASAIVTDSGGIQEEAPSLGVPVLVAREETERIEGVRAGLARLVGTDERTIVREAAAALHDSGARARLQGAVNPYGDGRAAERIVRHIADHLARERTGTPALVAGGTR